MNIFTFRYQRDARYALAFQNDVAVLMVERRGYLVVICLLFYMLWGFTLTSCTYTESGPGDNPKDKIHCSGSRNRTNIMTDQPPAHARHHASFWRRSLLRHRTAPSSINRPDSGSEFQSSWQERTVRSSGDQTRVEACCNSWQRASQGQSCRESVTGPSVLNSRNETFRSVTSVDGSSEEVRRLRSGLAGLC